MIEKGLLKKGKGEIEGSFVGERVKEKMAVRKGEVRRSWWWPIKGLTVGGKPIMEAGAAVWELQRATHQPLT